MSLIKVNNIESLGGPQGTINMTGNLIVNGMPISGQQGAGGPQGTVGPQGSTPVGGGISGSTVVYVSADSDPVTNGTALVAAYSDAKALATFAESSTSFSTSFNGMGTYFSPAGYGSMLQRAMAEMYRLNGNAPVTCTVDGTTAFYSWDGMSISMARNNMMTDPIEMGTFTVVLTLRVYTRSTLIIAPGYYETSSTFDIDGDYVNVTSISGEPNVFIYNRVVDDPMQMWKTPFVHVTANNATITGISTDLTDNISGGMIIVNGSGRITVGDNLAYLTMQNCIAGTYSFNSISGAQITLNGTYINCKAADYSFGNGDSFYSGTFIECETTGTGGFGYNSTTLNGRFTRCTSGGYSWGYYQCTLSGTFTDCVSLGGGSFGLSSTTISGTFTRCASETSSFGSANCTIGLTPYYYSCKSGSDSWKAVNNQGKYFNCIAGGNSWSSMGNGAALVHCTMQDSSFPTYSTGAITRYCVGNYVASNQG